MIEIPSNSLREAGTLLNRLHEAVDERPAAAATPVTDTATAQAAA